jgi:flagellar biosynthesis protein FlhG
VIDAYAMIKVIHNAIPDMPISVVMNAVRVPSEADDAVGKLAVAVNRFLGFSFSYRGAIPFDHDVALAVARQRPVLQEFPSSAASLSLDSLAKNLFGRSL